MVEDHVRDVRVLRCLRAGGFESVVDELMEYLHGRGHAPRVIEDYLRVTEHFAYWLEQVLYPTLFHALFFGLFLTEGRAFSHTAHSGGVL